ncbi:hypothetical protein [Streptomyces sp. rh34]|uniref:hypothetical protein n=1 Tax=Streptomyces sp. rh34 TaxID=2034272 RepID=UPI0015CF79F0|nr:hypothetical protein [Streptomyces sp. rh34]
METEDGAAVTEPASTLAYKAGSHPLGALREAGYWLGEVCDDVVMSTLAKDFTVPDAVRGAGAVPGRCRSRWLAPR